MDSARAQHDLAIDGSGLVKRFGATSALDHLDLQVAAGEVHAFLGPNGAGKSTTIRAILGQLRLDAGTLRVLGRDAWREPVPIHDRLAYVPGDVTLWPGLTGGECIDLLGRMQGHLDEARRDELVERFDLDPRKRTRGYSKGNRQKVALIAALAARADLLLLDEPTSGLDPLMEAEFQRCVREATDRGQTVLLSSHILAEVEALCDRVTIVRKGRTVRTATLGELRRESPATLDLVTDGPVRGLAHAPGVTRVEETMEAGGLHTTALVAAHELNDIVAAVLQHRPRSLTIRPADLESLFLEQYRTQQTRASRPSRERVS